MEFSVFTTKECWGFTRKPLCIVEVVIVFFIGKKFENRNLRVTDASCHEIAALVRGQLSFEFPKERIVIYGVTDASGLVVASLQRVRSSFENFQFIQNFEKNSI